MKRLKAYNLIGENIDRFEAENLDAFIQMRLKEKTWGFPERPELDADGNPTGVVLPAEYRIEIEDITAQVEQQKINEESLAYLASTDWMIIREMDQGTPCPADVKQKRAEARAKIVR